MAFNIVLLKFKNVSNTRLKDHKPFYILNEKNEQKNSNLFNYRTKFIKYCCKDRFFNNIITAYFKGRNVIFL